MTTNDELRAERDRLRIELIDLARMQDRLCEVRCQIARWEGFLAGLSV